MKKILNKILIISIICGVLSGVICWIAMTKDYKYDFKATKKVEEEVEMMKGSEFPGTGEYALIGGSTAAFLDFMCLLGALFFGLLIPGFILLLIIILQSVARLIQIGKEKNYKNKVSKVCTVISIVSEMCLCYLIIKINIFSLELRLFIFVLIPNAICLIIYINELEKMNRIMKTNLGIDKTNL